MGVLPDSSRQLITSGKLAHLITLDADGGPQVTAVWVGLDGEDIVIGHTRAWQKVRNVERDPRVAVSIDSDTYAQSGAQHSLVVYGLASVTEGGAYALLREISKIYLPDLSADDEPGTRAATWLNSRFPGGDDPGAGYVVRVQPTRVRGLGPWTSMVASRGGLSSSMS